jgi:hypothetical protein
LEKFLSTLSSCSEEFPFNSSELLGGVPFNSSELLGGVPFNSSEMLGGE